MELVGIKKNEQLMTRYKNKENEFAGYAKNALEYVTLQGLSIETHFFENVNMCEAVLLGFILDRNLESLLGLMVTSKIPNIASSYTHIERLRKSVIAMKLANFF